jgi:hypothetical protein
MLTASEWVGLGIFLAGGALVLAGLWMKMGPEIAMIFGGGCVTWLGMQIFSDD